MSNSILTSTKKMLGIGVEDKAFDLDVMTHINTVFSDLHDIGIGPANGFMIEDDTAQWADFFVEDTRLNSVKTLVYLKVRLVFDPPTTSYLITATQERIKELEWRLSVKREGTAWVDPTPVQPSDEDLMIDGGIP